jgi:8-oxo-dGTP pyrophosphatase MutT (NUDIX family)
MPLAGLKAQMALAPPHRDAYDLDKIVSLKPTPAAVMIILYPDVQGQARLVLMQRSNYQGHHARQISFPGGKKEKSDVGLLEAAIRETEEEIGLDLDKEKVLRALTQLYIPPSNFVVQPYVSLLDETPDFKPNYEVEKLILPTLTDILNINSIQMRSLTTRGNREIQSPCFILSGEVVWGATAMILSELRTLIKTVIQ